MQFVVVLLVLFMVVLVVTGPLRRGGAETLDVDAAREDLEAQRDSKYREIRDAELERRTGKLSDEDWRTVDRALRAEAVAILRRLDELPVAAPAAASTREPDEAAAREPEATPPRESEATPPRDPEPNAARTR